MDVGLDKALLQTVRDAARAKAPDRYMAALLAPRSYRDDLIVLAAFLGEIERIPRIVREPALGEIRLQWWVDWLGNLASSTTTGNPLADAMAEVILRRRLPVAPFSDLLEARVEDFYSDPVADEAAFAAYLDRIEAGPFRLAATIAGVEAESLSDDMVIAAARAYGTTRCLARLPLAIAHGRWPLPAGYLVIDTAQMAEPAARLAADQSRLAAIAYARAELARARSHCSRLPRNMLAALLPVALIEPYLEALQKGDDWLRTPVEISPLTRVWRLWRAWRTGRL